MKIYVPWFLVAFLAIALGIRSWQVAKLQDENLPKRLADTEQRLEELGREFTAQHIELMRLKGVEIGDVPAANVKKIP